ncbi:MAG: leucine-rich repeat protein [Tannerella sp.]|jgi:hypothetical protein|nr:leucine-rich repeat protein [Tannerella sp.]
MKTKILLFSLLLIFAAKIHGQNGMEGEITWKINDTNLIINGIGVMKDYDYEKAPWYNYRNLIKKIIIDNANGSEIITIGRYAFRDCKNLEKVEILSRVTIIGDGAFANCSSLIDINIPVSVTKIGDRAFSGCSNLKMLIFPYNILMFGNGVFFGCNNLTSVKGDVYSAYYDQDGILFFGSKKELVLYPSGKEDLSYTIPNSVNKIRYGAFYGARNLQNINIPEELTTIEKCAFYGCSNIQSIKIPNRVTSIESCSFLNCSNLSNIELPDNLETIQDFAFSGCNSLKNLIIPNSVNKIESYALADCKSLKRVEVDWTNPLVISPDSSIFDENTPVSDAILIVPTGTKEAYQNAFAWKDFGTIVERNNFIEGQDDNIFWKIIDSTLYISGTGAMKNYNGGTPPWYSYHNMIKKIVIEKGVTTVGFYSFFGFNKTTTVLLPEGITYIGAYAFYGCTLLTDIKIPSSVGMIYSYAFSTCHDLTQIELPRSTTTIAEGAFYKCDNLLSVKIFAVEYVIIGNLAFSDCKSLKSLEVNQDHPQSVKPQIFADYAGINYTTPISDAILIVPAGTKNAYETASVWKDFGTIVERETGVCGKEGNITWHITDSILYISGSGPMDIECVNNYNLPWHFRHKVKKVIIEEGITTITDYAFSGFSYLIDVQIPSSITKIGDDAFNYCYNLESIVIPENVTTIGHRAFYYCQKLSDIKLSDNILSMGDSVFHSCTSLTSIKIPDKVTIISNNSFHNCINLTDIKIPNDVTVIGDNAFGYCNKLDNVVLPDGLETIGTSAFTYCNSLSSIVIPNSVTQIKGDAFSCCAALHTIEVFWEESLITIPEGAWPTTANNTLLVVPAGTKDTYKSADFWKNFIKIVEKGGTIEGQDGNIFWKIIDSTLYISGTGAMKNYNYAIGIPWYPYRNMIKEVIIGEGITTIGFYAFYDCYKITTATLPEGITYIGSYAFYGCTSLTDIEIPSNVGVIYSYAFSYCYALTHIDIPQSTTTITEGAFYKCDNLTNIKISATGYVIIGNYVFSDCKSLKTFEVNWEVPQSVKPHIFADYAGINYTSPISGATLIVPAGTKTAYETASVWKDFGIIIEKVSGRSEKSDATNNEDYRINDKVKVSIINGTLTIDSPDPEKITVYNINGILVYTAVKKEGRITFDLHNLPNGIYFVNSNNGWSKKVLKRL